MHNASALAPVFNSDIRNFRVISRASFWGYVIRYDGEWPLRRGCIKMKAVVWCKEKLFVCKWMLLSEEKIWLHGISVKKILIKKWDQKQIISNCQLYSKQSIMHDCWRHICFFKQKKNSGKLREKIRKYDNNVTWQCHACVIDFMRCHYRQNWASVIFINGASVFENSASNFENGASVFINGTLILEMVPLIFVIGAPILVNDTSNFVNDACNFCK